MPVGPPQLLQGFFSSVLAPGVPGLLVFGAAVGQEERQVFMVTSDPAVQTVMVAAAMGHKHPIVSAGKLNARPAGCESVSVSTDNWYLIEGVTLEP